jgi:signal transduction histidine kinase
VLVTVDIAVAGNVLRESAEGWRLPLSLAVAAAVAVLVVARRRRPAAVLAASTALSLPAAVIGVLWDPLVGAALALYALVATRRVGIAVPVAVGAAALVAAGAGELLRPGTAWWYAAGAPLAAAAWWLGTLTRDRREQAAELAAQREHDVLVEERLRIARELHDVLTHGMGLIAVQAGVANHIADARPEAAREALVSIEAASRDALADVRRLLGTLREDTGRTPPPALADLPTVVARAAAAGVEVELTVAGTADLPAPVELAAYRIVQEAVTNVVKHAAPASCRATVEAVDGVLRVEVTNGGAPLEATPNPGHGIVGMRERVALYAGGFSAGPLDGGGFRVLATLPYGPS